MANISKEFLETELASLEQERARQVALLHQIDAGLVIYRLLLDKLDEDEPAQQETADADGKSDRDQGD